MYNLFVSNEALMLYAVIGVCLVAFLVKKFGVNKSYVDIAVAIFNYIEDNYKDLGIKGNDKLDFFIGQFIEQYQNKFNQNPTEDIMHHVINLVEEMVLKQHQQ